MQAGLGFPVTSKDEHLRVFKDVYYHLYSNSNISRAEDLIKDLSKILLYCLSENSVDVKVRPSKILDTLINQHPNIKDHFDSFQLDDISVLYALNKFQEIDISNSPAHIIGDAFQTLVGPNLRGDKGQFFTPKSVVSSMVKLLSPEANHTICDPACGTAGFLIESITQISNTSNFNGRLIGIEKDDFLSNTANAILEIYSKSNFEVINSNSLDIENDTLKKLLGEIDLVITNPPFGAKIGVKEKKILKQYDFGHSWMFSKTESQWIKTGQILKEQSPQLLFLELCFKLLKKGGKCGIVLPEGIFGNKSLGYVWDYIRKNGKILGMIDCPRTLFQPSTDVKTNILFFEKSSSTNEKFKVAIAETCGHDKRGRQLDNSGKKIDDDFTLIGEKSFNENNQTWKHATVQDPYYLVPRYCISRNQLNKAYEFEIAGHISIKELVDQKRLVIKKGNEVGSEAYGTGQIPFVRTSDIINLEINYDPTKSVSEEVYQKYKKLQRIEEFDILMVADGRFRIGKTSMILNGMTKCVVQSHLKIIRILDKNYLNAFELLYLLNQKVVIDEIKRLIFIQSTLGSIGSRLNELVLPVPVKNQLWNEKIEEFKQTLIERNRLLQKLHNFTLDEMD